MKILSWNCRGVAATPTARELRNICSNNKPSIVFLMETRARREKIEELRRRLGFDYYFTVDPRGISGGLALLWKKEVHIHIFQSSAYFIHSSVQASNDTSPWDCTFVYGDPCPQRRRLLWPQIAAVCYKEDTPWCLLGDFNDILHNHEKEGLRPQSPLVLQRFRDFVHSLELMDIDLKGCKFTWHNNPRDGFVTREKIDRVLVNWRWRALFQNATAIAYPQITSDHSPILFDHSPTNRSKNLFKYEVFWDEHEQCGEIVAQGWSKPTGYADPWQDLSKRINNSKNSIWQWQKKTFKVADKEIERLQQDLLKVQGMPHHLVDWNRVKDTKEEIDRLWRQEELFWGQRSRIKWARYGDKNSRFFHASTIQR
ncbi:uncharacterized protein LOC130725388 [Lotus japonicus]|uniref:uncharacterized protein LOC130725388 n=1 Tax=Lotus japonicus TaxID=34305 RepID=UPI002588E162|nr:uncharacterized protein LOC130725388 [Lotus japonicus]